MMGTTHLQQQKITDYGYNTADASEAAPVTGVGRAMRRLAGWFSRGHDRMTRMTVWVRRRTLWSKGAEKRGQKAVVILERQDQIRYVHPGLYSVQSQSQPGLFYFVKLTPTGGWVCDCPDHQHRKAQCKHILAVSALVSDKEALAVLNAPGDDACESQVKCGPDEGPQKSIDDVAYRDSYKVTQKHPKKPAKAKHDALEKPDAEESKASQGKKKNGASKKKTTAKKRQRKKTPPQESPPESPPPIHDADENSKIWPSKPLPEKLRNLPTDEDGTVHVYAIDVVGRPPRCKKPECNGGVFLPNMTQYREKMAL